MANNHFETAINNNTVHKIISINLIEHGLMTKMWTEPITPIENNKVFKDYEFWESNLRDFLLICAFFRLICELICENFKISWINL